MADTHPGIASQIPEDPAIDPRLLFWTQDEPVRNFGDLLSAYIAEKGLIAPLFPADRYRLIGSAIDEALLAADLRQVGKDDATIACWGCGARSFAGLSDATRTRTALFGVRGPLSRATLELQADTPLGDPALLLPLLYKPNVSAGSDPGEVLCAPHFNEPLGDQEVLSRTGADAILSPRVRSFADCERLIDRIASAEFVLAGSLHAAIVAFAYGTPFAFLDLGFVDAPFKWRDFAALVRIEPEWSQSVSEARGRAQRNVVEACWPALLPMLAACPWGVRPELILAARGVDDEHGHATALPSDDGHTERIRAAQRRALQRASSVEIHAAGERSRAVAAALDAACLQLNDLRTDLHARAAAAAFSFAPDQGEARVLTFAAGSAGSAMLQGQWVAPNELGPITWASQSRIVLPVASGWALGAELVLEGLVYAPPASALDGRRKIRIFINGAEVLFLEAVNPGQEESYLECIRVPLSAGCRERGGELEVQFVFAEQVSPFSLGLSAHDDRPIGMVPLRMWIA